MARDEKRSYSVTAFVRSYYNSIDNSQIAEKVYNELNLLYDGIKDAANEGEAEEHLEKLIPYLSSDGLDFLSGLEEHAGADEKISIDDIAGAIEEYKKLHERDREPVDVTVTSAVPLSTDQKDRIIANFRKNVGDHHLFIHEVVDKNVMGGVRLETENYYYDNTIITKLKEMKEHILNDH